MLKRTAVVLLTVVVGVYVAIWAANLGGSADELRRETMKTSVTMSFMGNTEYTALPLEDRQQILSEALAVAYAEADLDRPFFLRSFRYLADALSLSLGEARVMTTPVIGSHDVRDILLHGLPATAMLFAAANLLTFLVSLALSLVLAGRYGSFLDRAVTLLIPAFTAPPWLYGIFLIILFASIAGVLPYGGYVDTPPPGSALGYSVSVLKHMVLPVIAWMFGSVAFALYTNRAFFLIYSKEDYVELAKAKGLRRSRVQRRYLLRPTLPPILTNFAFTMIVAWEGAILTEYVFAWPGLGSTLLDAIRMQEAAVVTGAVAVFAYFLAACVLLLDVAYALVDPRVKLGSGRRS